MATTALFAEILVVGLLAMPWFVLAVLSFTRVQLNALPDLQGWEPLLLAVGLAFAYALGIVVDRLGDWAFERWDEALSQSVRRSNAPGSDLPDRAELRFRLMHKAPPLVLEFLDYARSRRRILRGVTVNSLLTLLVASGTVTLGPILGAQAIPTTAALSLSEVALVVGAGAIFGWWHIGRMYYQRSLVAYKLFGPGPEPP